MGLAASVEDAQLDAKYEAEAEGSLLRVAVLDTLELVKMGVNEVAGDDPGNGSADLDGLAVPLSDRVKVPLTLSLPEKLSVSLPLPLAE